MIRCLPPRPAMAAMPKLEVGSSVSPFVHTDGNALQKAVRLGKLRLTRLLVEGGTDIHSVDDDGRTALTIACMMKYEGDERRATKLKIVTFLLENKAKVDVQDKHGRTCLMYACIERSGKDVISILLKYDADPRIIDKNGSSALVYAINARDSAVLSLLIDTCKNKGKDVIIITTNDRGQQRETKQYLNVPPSLAQSPPFYQCISPSQVEWDLSKTFEVPSPTESNTDALSPKVRRKREKSLKELSRSPENSPRSPVLSPRSQQRLQLAPLQSSIPTRRLVRRSSMGLLYDTGTISPSRSHPDLPEETEEDASKDSTSNTPILQSTSSESLHKSPRTFRRPFLRRQSADAFNPSMLSANNLRMQIQPLSSTNSTPEKKSITIGITNRRCSLPAMPPPLRKSQTVHAINVPKALLDMKQSMDSNYDSDANSNPDIANEPNHVLIESGKKLVHPRRGSASFILEDEISFKRPGTLPPLNVNPRPPIPDIGATTFKLSPRLERHADGRVTGDTVASHDRRYSIQVEDMRRLTSLYQRETDRAEPQTQADLSGDSGAECS